MSGGNDQIKTGTVAAAVADASAVAEALADALALAAEAACALAAAAAAAGALAPGSAKRDHGMKNLPTTSATSSFSVHQYISHKTTACVAGMEQCSLRIHLQILQFSTGSAD